MSTALNIENAALDVFYVKGYHGASIRAIAGSADIGIATLFHHYPTKAAILEQVLHRAADRMQEELDEALADVTGAVPRFEVAVRTLVTAHCERQKQSFVAQSELRSLEPEAAVEIRRKRRKVQAVFDDAITDGITSGDFSCEMPNEVARAIVSMGTMVASWYRSDKGMAPSEVADVYVGMALRLVAAKSDVPSVILVAD